MLVMFPHFVSAHLILGNLGCALVQLAGLESSKKKKKKDSQFAHFADLAEMVAACLVCCSFVGAV